MKPGYCLQLYDEPGIRTTWWAPSDGYTSGVAVWWLVFGDQRVRPATDVEVDLYYLGWTEGRLCSS